MQTTSSPRHQDLRQALREQWTAEAQLRRLNDPHPLPVSWEAVDPSLVQPWQSLVRLATTGAGWPPVSAEPSTRGWATGPDDLAGTDGDLAHVLDSVPTRRLVVLGEPGSGKTMLLVRLILDLLARRPPGGPVPVLFPLASWNPVYQPLDQWLADRLATDYPALGKPAPHGASGRTLAHMMISTGMLILLLDGLDEIPDETRPAAIDTINESVRAGQPLVLASRLDAYRLATRPTHGVHVQVAGAAGVRLRRLDTTDIATYLHASAGGTAAARRWNPIINMLATEPTAPITEALRTPLMVSLARAIYNPRPGEPAAAADRTPHELLDLDRFPTRVELEHHLFDAFIAAAYRTHPDPRRQTRWSAADAERWLAFLARHLQDDLDGTTDLAWWQLLTAVSEMTLLRLAATTSGLICGSATVLATWLTSGPVDALILGPVSAFVGGYAGIFALIIAAVFDGGPVDRPAQALRWRPRRFTLGPAAGLLAGLPVTLALRPAEGAIALTIGIVAGLACGFDITPLDRESAVGPRSALALDRAAFLTYALSLGLATSLTIGLVIAFERHVVHAFGGLLLVLMTLTLTLVFAASLARTAWGWFAATRTILMWTHDLPRELIAFLEDAHENRGVLRRVGAVYHFRHLDLQRRLATTEPKPR